MVTADYYTLTKSALLLFLQYEVENCWHGRPLIKSTTLDLSSQSGAHDLSATIIKVNKVKAIF